jgi:hypothetical protein
LRRKTSGKREDGRVGRKRHGNRRIKVREIRGKEPDKERMDNDGQERRGRKETT